jgi:hypothetical protein
MLTDCLSTGTDPTPIDLECLTPCTQFHMGKSGIIHELCSSGRAGPEEITCGRDRADGHQRIFFFRGSPKKILNRCLLATPRQAVVGPRRRSASERPPATTKNERTRAPIAAPVLPSSPGGRVVREAAIAGATELSGGTSQTVQSNRRGSEVTTNRHGAAALGGGGESQAGRRR